MFRPGEVQAQPKRTAPADEPRRAVSVVDGDRSAIPFDPETGRLIPRTFGQLQQIATLIAKTEFAPKTMRGKPEDCFVAMCFGAGMGLQFLQACQNIAVINGQPSLYGDAIPALVQSSGVVYRSYFVLDGEEQQADFTPPWKHDDYPDGFGAVVRGSRDGGPEVVRAWSVAMAKNASLWDKRGQGGPSPWITYPHTMLYRRAMGDFAKAIVPDRMLGLIPSQEAQDMPLEAEFVDMPVEPTRTAEVEPQREPTTEPLWGAAVDLTSKPGPAGMADPIPLRPEDEERLEAAATRGDEVIKRVRRKRNHPAILPSGVIVKTAGITAGTYTLISRYQDPSLPDAFAEEIIRFIGELNLTTETVDNLREEEGARLLLHLRKIEERLSAADAPQEDPAPQEQQDPHPLPESLVGTVEGAVESEGSVYLRCPNRSGDLMTPDFCRSGCGPASSECPAWDPLPRESRDA